WGAFLFMGVVGLLLAMIVNMFIHSTALTMAISTIAVFVFTGLAAYKTQALKAWAHTGGPQGETLAIFGALSLYITFINLFLHILRLFGRGRRGGRGRRPHAARAGHAALTRGVRRGDCGWRDGGDGGRRQRAHGCRRRGGAAHGRRRGRIGRRRGARGEDAGKVVDAGQV